MVNGVATSDLRDALEAEARRLGFVAFGIARADATAPHGERLEAWLGEGMHGSMEWMAARSAQRRAPQALWPEVQSVIALGMSYAPAADRLALAGEPDRGRISAYAQGVDYHDVVKKALKALARWLIAEAGRRGHADADVKVFVDTAPVMEKPLATEAGLGWQGKHTNLVSRKHGSWLFLGEIFTTLPLPADPPGRDRCGSCQACQLACPTDAFPAPYRLDARRCISYLTIEHKGPIPAEFREAIGNRIYGCDDCLAACPWNKFASTAAAHRAFLPRAELAAPRLSELIALGEQGFRRVFAGSPIKRIGWARFLRNCLIAAGNSGKVSLRAPVARHVTSEDPGVADAARWSLARLEGGSRT